MNSTKGGYFPKFQASCKIGSSWDPSPLLFMIITSLNHDFHKQALTEWYFRGLLEPSETKFSCSTRRWRPRWSPRKTRKSSYPQVTARFFLEKDYRSEYKANLEVNMWPPGSFLRNVSTIWQGTWNLPPTTSHGSSPFLLKVQSQLLPWPFFSKQGSWY